MATVGARARRVRWWPLGRPEVRDLAPREDPVDEAVRRWTRVEQVSDHSLRVVFTGGTTACFGYRVLMEESERSVRISLVEGLLPGATDPIPLVAASLSMRAELEQPLGRRRVECR